MARRGEDQEDAGEEKREMEKKRKGEEDLVGEKEERSGKKT